MKINHFFVYVYFVGKLMIDRHQHIVLKSGRIGIIHRIHE
jgi:hypothetical protein